MPAVLTETRRASLYTVLANDDALAIVFVVNETVQIHSLTASETRIG